MTPAPSGTRPPIERSAAAESLCGVTQSFYRRGWCLGTSGNFSILLQDDPIHLLITRSGCDKARLTSEDLVIVGRDGKAVAGETRQPSAEALLHATVAAVTRARAVLHVHSVWNTLLSEHYLAAGGFVITGYEMLKGLEGVDTHRAEVFVPVVANSQDMAALSAYALELLAEWPSTNGFLIAGHGLYTWGSTLADAQRHVEVFEFLFECVGRKARLDEAPGHRPGV